MNYQSFEIIIIILSVLGSPYLAQELSSPCDGITCSNKGICSPNEAYAQGYWCECNDGWAGQNCSLSEPTVVCGDDEITVAIERALVQELGIDDNPRYVYFGHSSASNQCKAEIKQDSLYVLKIKAPFSNCGTRVIQKGAGDDYTFSNTVVWNSEVQNSGSVINRNFMLLDFKCIYEDTYTVSGPVVEPTHDVLHFANEKGQFEVRMRIFEDNSFAPEHEYRKSPSIHIGSFVYVQVELSHVKDGSLVVTMDRCFASQSSDPLDTVATKHWLITERCADDDDDTVQILFNGEKTVGRFKFQMFKWRWSADPVYLHCEIDICNQQSEVCIGDGYNCKGSGGFRKKRDLARDGKYSSTTIGNFVSEGPIQVEADDELLDFYSKGYIEDEDDTTLIFVGAMLGLIAIIAIVVVLLVIRRRNLALLKQNEKSINTSQRLTSLKFTTEAF